MSTPEGDRCRAVTVTGDAGEPVTIGVFGCADLTAEGLDALGEVVRAAQRMYRTDHPGAGCPPTP